MVLSESRMTFSSQPRVFGGKGRGDSSKRAYTGSSMVIVSTGWIAGVEERCLSATGGWLLLLGDDDGWMMSGDGDHEGGEALDGESD